MTPQEWIEEAGKRWRWPHGEFGQIGAQHLAAALEEIARLQAQLAQVQAERVVVPELALDGMSTAAFVEGYRFAQSRAHSAPSSRVLKDGDAGSRMSEGLSRPANDITRCHDDACPSREVCSRWVYRDDRGPRTPHVGTMRFGGGCEHYDFAGNPHEKDGVP